MKPVRIDLINVVGRRWIFQNFKILTIVKLTCPHISYLNSRMFILAVPSNIIIVNLKHNCFRRQEIIIIFWHNKRHWLIRPIIRYNLNIKIRRNQRFFNRNFICKLHNQIIMTRRVDIQNLRVRRSHTSIRRNIRSTIAHVASFSLTSLITSISSSRRRIVIALEHAIVDCVSTSFKDLACVVKLHDCCGEVWASGACSCVEVWAEDTACAEAGDVVVGCAVGERDGCAKAGGECSILSFHATEIVSWVFRLVFAD